MSWAAEGHLSTSRLRMKVTQGKAELKDEEREMRFDDVVWAPESSHVWSPSFYSWTNKFPFCVYASFDWFSVNCSWNSYDLYKLFCAFFINKQELLYFSTLLIWKWRPCPFVIRCFTSHKIQSLFAPFCLGNATHRHSLLLPASAWAWTYFILLHERLLNTISTPE